VCVREREKSRPRGRAGKGDEVRVRRRSATLKDGRTSVVATMTWPKYCQATISGSSIAVESPSQPQPITTRPKALALTRWTLSCVNHVHET
jgi:hypothetical protein